MPLSEATDAEGRPGIRWGTDGTLYLYDPADPASRKAATVKAMKQAVAMGQGSRSAPAAKRSAPGEIITAGERVLADALVDGVEEYGRVDAAAAGYMEAPGDGPACANCIFYRGDEYAGAEGCVVVAADVDGAGGCRLGIEGVLPMGLEDEDEAGEEEQEDTLADALEDVDEALDLGEADEDDDEDQDADDSGVTVIVNVTVDNDVDTDNGANHNASDGSAASAEGDAEVGADAGDVGEVDDSLLTGLEPTDPGMVPERSAYERKVVYRDSGAGRNYRTIAGYPVVWGARSCDLGGFREQFQPGAFSDALASGADVRLLYSHDPAMVLARTSNGTLELVEDDIGLRMWARVDMRDPHVQMVAAKLANGTVDQCSFGFIVSDTGEDWAMEGNTPLRTVTRVDSLIEATICAMPAYESTRVGILERGQRALARTPNGRGNRRASHVAAADPSGVSSQGIALGRDSQRSQRATVARMRASLARKRKEAQHGRQDFRGTPGA